MRIQVREFVRLVSNIFDINEPIYEFGSYQVEGQDSISNIRELFKNKKYIGADMRCGPGVDIILNLHNINLSDNVANTVLVLDTLEHVEYPRKAMDEIHRILGPKGLVIISSVMNFPVHEYPFDYWRFTTEGFRSMLKIFECSFVGYLGSENHPHTILGIGLKYKSEKLNKFKNEYNKWFVKYNSCNKIKYYIKLISPPIILNIIKKYFKY